MWHVRSTEVGPLVLDSGRPHVRSTAVSRGGRADMAHIRQTGPDSGLGVQVKVLTWFDRLRVGWLNEFSFSISTGACARAPRARRGTTRAEDAQGTPAQSHISPSMLVYEDCVVGSVEELEVDDARAPRVRP